MAAAARRAASSGLTALTHRLTKQFSAAQRNPANGATARTAGNLVFSPLSIYSALSLVAAGAGGKTLSELLGLLGARPRAALAGDVRGMVERATARDAAQPCAPRVVFASGLWHDSTRALKPAYRDAAAESCMAVARAVDFLNKPDEAGGQINSWVAAMTSNLIDTIVEPASVTRDTRMVLANAIYFKGKWEKPFAWWRTKDHKFHRLDGTTVDAKFMSCHKDQFIATHDGFKVLKMPYRVRDNCYDDDDSPGAVPTTVQPQYSMCIFLPDAPDGLWSIEEKMASSPGFLHEHLPDKRVPVGKFQVPKFKMSFSASVKRCLMDLGVEAMFRPGANLQDMLENDGSGEPLFVGDVLHKTVIDVNEQGTEAAAATLVHMLGAGMPPKPPPTSVDFVADHPFAFFLVDEVSGAVLFAGHVLDPTQPK
ncbi:hypothetical protein ACP70R_004590 [Stipagrostis hirtigluma subsp. patula]